MHAAYHQLAICVYLLIHHQRDDHPQSTKAKKIRLGNGFSFSSFDGSSNHNRKNR